MQNFTQQAIKASFKKLLNEKPLSQITVKDIVEDCGVNRNSFYYHFQDMPALIEEIVQELINQAITTHPTIETFEECLNVVVSFALQNKKAVFHIYNSVDHSILEKYLLKMSEYAVTAYMKPILDKYDIEEDTKRFIIRHYKCLSFGHAVAWLNGGMKEDVKEDIHKFCVICDKLIYQNVEDIARDYKNNSK